MRLPRPLFYSCLISALFTGVARAGALPAAAPATAAAPRDTREARTFHIAAADASESLVAFSRQSGAPLVYVVEQVRGIRTNGLDGRFHPREALSRLLAQTALTLVEDARTGALMIKPSDPSRGPPPASPAPPPDPPKINQSKHNESPPVKPRTLLTFLTGWLYATTVAVGAQTTGTIEGRVENAAAGTYLGNARLTIAGGLETFTDAFGNYRFPAVPVGEANVGVFYTGFPTQEKLVRVVAGQVVTQNFSLSALGKSDPDATVKLDAFVVAAGREISAAGLAVNEQRYTQSIKTVVSSDTFGDTADGNVGEFVKFLPGVSLGYTGGQASAISLGGVPADFTPITIDGNRLASAT